MGRLFLVELDGELIFKCKHCSVDLAVFEDLMLYFGPLGAYNTHTYEFRKVVNITLGDTESYYDTSNCHGVEIFCVQCLSLLGWKHMRYENQIQEEADIEDIRSYYLEWEQVITPGGPGQ